MRIAVDFDGTIVEHCFPEIGPAVPGAIDWLKRFVDAGAELILWTVRGNAYLETAADYCKTNGIQLLALNRNPGQQSWSPSPKAYAAIYIDDAAFGCPVIPSTTGRPMVNWAIVGPQVLARLAQADTFANAPNL